MDKNNKQKKINNILWMHLICVVVHQHNFKVAGAYFARWFSKLKIEYSVCEKILYW